MTRDVRPGEWCANCGSDCLAYYQDRDDVPLCKGCHTNWVRAGYPDEVPQRKHPANDLSRTPAPQPQPERPVLPGKRRSRKILDLEMDKPYRWRSTGDGAS